NRVQPLDSAAPFSEIKTYFYTVRPISFISLTPVSIFSNLVFNHEVLLSHYLPAIHNIKRLFSLVYKLYRRRSGSMHWDCSHMCGQRRRLHLRLQRTKMTMLGLSTYSHVRGCGQSSDCNNPKSLSNQFISIDLNTLCCQTDECTPTAPIVLSEKKDSNGLACPSCFTITSSTCKPDNQIQCTGTENRCTSYSISTATDPSEPILAMAGCATENMCSNYDGHATTSTTEQMKISIECSNALRLEQATRGGDSSFNGSLQAEAGQASV
ncbi:unnamed protein product, partial [Ranitomeya imitator]